MKKTLFIVALALGSVSMHSPLFSEVSLLTKDATLGDGNISLLRPSYERIQKKQAVFQAQCKAQERNQLVFAACAGVILGISGAMLLEYFLKPSDQSAQAQIDSIRLFNELQHQNVQMLNDLQIQYLQERAERSTVKGRLKWAADNVFSMVLYGLAGTVATRIIGSIIPGMKTCIGDLVGSNQGQVFVDFGLKMMHNTQKLAQSLRACALLPQEIEKDDPLHHVVIDYKVRNVIVDHHAFIESLETFIAFIIVTTQNTEFFDSTHKDEIELTISTFLDLIIHVIDNQEHALRTFSTSNDGKEIKSVIGGLKNVHTECERLLHNIGLVVYEKDDRVVSEEV
jgi:hypothetical protein